MSSDSDADRIREEQQRRRREQRMRLEEDRQRRAGEARRLRQNEPGAKSATPARTPSPLPPPPRERGGSRPVGPPPESGKSSRSELPPRPPAPPRVVGGPVYSEPVRQMLSLDTAERFDLRVLNRISISGMASEVTEDAGLLRRVIGRIEDLMLRLKRELDDPLTAGAFLREQALLWYRRSPETSDWSGRMSDDWGGLFSETRIIGGKLHPWLNARLGVLREQLRKATAWTARFRESRARTRAVEAASARTPTQQIQAEVAQAILDDLAMHPRDGPITPMVHLSELAVRRQVMTVNEILASLFNSPELGPFVVLHPNRYPDCDELFIRAPAPNATGAALAYSLVRRPPARRAAAGATAAGAEGVAESADAGAGVPLEEVNLWEEAHPSDDLIRKTIEQTRAERKRLPSPPKDFRNRPGYLRLRELVMQEDALRAPFLAVKWRGRPSGFPLLIALLKEGSLAPEVSTDHEYLEAELAELSGLDPARSHEPTEWTIPGWKVTKESSPDGGIRFKAEKTAAPTPPS